MAVFAGQWGPEGLEYPNGGPAGNVLFEVRTTAGFTVPLWSNKDRTVAIANPGRTDELGNIYFFANPGSYILDVSGRLLPVTVNLHPDEPISAGGGASGWTHSVANPATLHQIVHGFSWKPAGILSIDSIGDTVEYQTVSHPAAGVTEIRFGVPFGPGVIHLS